MDSDWHVWPIFVVELVAFLLFFFRAQTKLLGLRMQTWVIIFLLGVDIGIVISLIHDRTEKLNMYF